MQNNMVPHYEEVDLSGQSAEYELNLEDKKQLRKCYMPFIKNGGMFVPTTKSHELNDRIVFSVKIYNDPKIYLLMGKVVWLNPTFVDGGRSAGVGLQFVNKESRALHHKIETILAGFKGDSDSTETM